MYINEALYFTTTVILVDDDPSFLKILSGKLSNKYIVKAFNNPKEAVIYIESIQSMFNIVNPSSIIDDEELEYGEHRLSLEKIQAISENEQKKNLPAVIISDYAMPEMNGIEFFEALTDMPVMKILLTGNADLDLALYAFNRSIVDKFLVKNSPKILSDVEEAIDACQHGFFRKQSYPILNSLCLPEDSLLNKTYAIKALEEVIRKHDIVEYYLIDSMGSYFLMTKNGKRIYLIYMHDRQLDEYFDVAVTARVSNEIIEKLKNRTHAPVFTSEKEYKLPVEEWLSIMRPMEKNEVGYFVITKED